MGRLGSGLLESRMAESWAVDAAAPGRPIGSPFLPTGDFPVRNALGFMLQMAVLMFLPLVIGWQLFFGFPLLAMPAATLAAIVLFSLGHNLRQRQ
jgi:hypothetical protein